MALWCISARRNAHNNVLDSPRLYVRFGGVFLLVELKAGGIEPIQSERRWRSGAFRLDEMHTMMSSIPLGSTVILMETRWTFLYYILFNRLHYGKMISTDRNLRR